MKLTRLLLVTMVLVVFGSALSYADTYDPRIGVGEPSCQGSDQIVTSNTFSATTDGNGGGQFFFCNESGNDWQNLYFFANVGTLSDGVTPTITPAEVTCDPGAFVFCQAFTNPAAPPGFLYIEFAGVAGIAPPICPNACPGVPNNEEFFVDFNCDGVQGCNPWIPNLQFTAVANSNGVPIPAPEPASMAFIATSLVTAGAIKLRRRFSKRPFLS